MDLLRAIRKRKKGTKISEIQKNIVRTNQNLLLFFESYYLVISYLKAYRFSRGALKIDRFLLMFHIWREWWISRSETRRSVRIERRRSTTSTKIRRKVLFWIRTRPSPRFSPPVYSTERQITNLRVFRYSIECLCWLTMLEDSGHGIPILLTVRSRTVSNKRLHRDKFFD